MSNKKEQQSASELRQPQLHAANSFKRKRPLADDELGKYRKIRIISLPDGLLTGEKTVSYSRFPLDDELYVMQAFTRHASHCSTCAQPFETHRKGDKLCSKGNQRALDVAQYVFNKAGQTFSTVDLDDNRRVQLKIPANCSVVQELLKAMERGLRLRQKVSVISFDKTYHIQSGRVMKNTLPPSSRPEKHSHSDRGRRTLYHLRPDLRSTLIPTEEVSMTQT